MHGHPSGSALSDAIKRACAKHHGHAGRAFLERLSRDQRDMAELLEKAKALSEFTVVGGDGQEKRAAARFAIMALAGELATEYDITGWTEGDAIKAAAEAFKAWRSMRGAGNDEHRQIVERVAEFIDKHGDSRFSDVLAGEAHTRTINRAGWWRDEGGVRVHLFTAGGMREALVGFDFKRALDALQKAGALPSSGAERAKPERINGRVVKVYPIRADKLIGSDGG